MPESLRWLLENKTEKAARHVMQITYSDEEIDREIKEMKELAEKTESSWSVLKSKWLRPTLIIIGCTPLSYNSLLVLMLLSSMHHLF